MLDVKATDDEVTNLWGLIPLHPSPKTKARVEIHQIIEQAGMLPFAVPETDPARVAALFINEDTGLKVDQQYLCKGGPNNVFSYWTTCDGSEPDAPVPPAPNNPIVDIPAENTSVIILISKNDPNPNISLGLPNVCTQSPGLIRCHASSGPTGGASFIHGWSDPAGAPNNPTIHDVSVFGCGTGEPSGPYFLTSADCDVGVTAEIDWGHPGAPRTATPRSRPHKVASLRRHSCMPLPTAEEAATVGVESTSGNQQHLVRRKQAHRRRVRPQPALDQLAAASGPGSRRLRMLPACCRALRS